MKKIVLALSLLGSLALSAQAMTITQTSPLWSGVISSTQNVVLDMNAERIDYLSATAAYSSATLSTSNFVDGAKSVATITPKTVSGLSAAVSSDTITVSSNSALTNASFTIADPSRSLIFTQGQQWFVGNTSSNTAVSILNALSGFPALFTVSTNTTTSVLIQLVKGAQSGNSFTLTSSTPTALVPAAANFVGGQNAASFTIQGVTKVANVDWTVGASSVTAATAIVGAINSDPYLSTIIVATTTVTCPGCGIVYATSTVVGVNNWNLTSSTPTALLVSSTSFTGGLASAVTTSNSSLSLPSHGFATGTAVLFLKSAGTPPGVLLSGTTYFAVVLDGNDIQLASSYANATAVPAVVVGISTQTVAGGGSFTLSPLSLAGNLVLGWYASNDDVNFNLLTLPNNVTPATVTQTPAGAAASTYWDFGQLNPRYLELKILGPTQGAYNLTVTPYGKSQANGY